MGDVADLAERRWNGVSDPNKHAPIEALRAALRDIETGAVDPKHIIVSVARRGPEENSTMFYQAGEYQQHGQLGLATRVLYMLHD